MKLIELLLKRNKQLRVFLKWTAGWFIWRRHQTESRGLRRYLDSAPDRAHSASHRSLVIPDSQLGAHRLYAKGLPLTPLCGTFGTFKWEVGMLIIPEDCKSLTNQ